MHLNPPSHTPFPYTTLFRSSTLDRLWLGERPTAAINIGGIANLTLVAGGVVTGDTGPGNCLIDDAVRQHFAMPYDREGRSEERRVGKEWRSRWATDDEKRREKKNGE